MAQKPIVFRIQNGCTGTVLYLLLEHRHKVIIGFKFTFLALGKMCCLSLSCSARVVIKLFRWVSTLVFSNEFR